MFLKLKDGRKLNLLYLSDCFLGKHDKTIVIFYLTNGTKLIEGYATPKEAEERVDEVKLILEQLGFGGLIQRDTFDDFPEKGNKGSIYLAKDTGQTYYWDIVTQTYITTGTAGRTGVYKTDIDLPATIGSTTILNKSDLVEILKPTVDYSDGSEIIGNNSIHGIIVGSDENTVTIKTITDLVIDSFQQVTDMSQLPANGIANILYYVKDIDEFRVWDDTAGEYVEPFHPIIFVDNDIAVSDARLYTLYVIGNKIKYTTDNINWIEVNKHVDGYNQDTVYHKDMFLYLGETVVRVVDDYTSDNTMTTILESFEKDIEDGKLIEVGGGAKLEEDITSNVDCGAAPKGSFFPEGMTFQEFAEKILRKEIDPTISATFSNSGVKQVGVPVPNTTMKLTITNLADVTRPIDRIEFYLDGVLIDAQAYVAGQTTYQYTYNTPITSNVPVNILAEAILVYDTTKVVRKTGNFTFAYPSFAGVTSLATITDADATTLATTFTKIIKTTKGYTWNNITVNDERFCYMYPKSFGALASIIDGNGFNQMGSYTMFTVNVTDATTGNIEPYYVYLLTDPTTGTGFKQVYA